MPDTKPILDLSNNSEELSALKLMAELARGERSGLENGWLTLDDVESECLG